MSDADAYAELIRRSKELGVLNSCAALISWDQQTYMPRNGAVGRGEQMGLLASLAHQKLTDPANGELLTQLATAFPSDSPEAANVREIRRSYDRATKLPQSLVEEMARVTSQAQHAWEQAKKGNDFPAFRPWLTRILELKRQEAAAIGFTGSPYDALLDEFEPDTTAADIQKLFAGLTPELVKLRQAIADSSRKPDRSIFDRDFPIDRQKMFAESASAAIGFDFAGGRLDTTAHPFCSPIGPGDCRITTRYNPRSFAESFFGVIHETGHALYEQNLPTEHFGTPLGVASSFGIHESQSRLWENQVARGRPFWDHFFPRLRQTFPGVLDSVSLEAFYFAVNDVKPTLIRVEANEVEYNLHIALRFELELALLTGDLAVADLPTAWYDRTKALLGLDVPDDARGCLQDIHWSFGGFGYFPSYTLGNLYAAQFLDAATTSLGGAESVAADFRRGDFSRLKDWLIQNIHRHGRRYRASELCVQATGKPLEPGAFLRHLNEKYKPLFGVC